MRNSGHIYLDEERLQYLNVKMLDVISLNLLKVSKLKNLITLNYFLGHLYSSDEKILGLSLLN